MQAFRKCTAGIMLVEAIELYKQGVPASKWRLLTREGFAQVKAALQKSEY